MNLKREKYLEKIRPYYDIEIIKVLTGVRRAGKSIILKSIISEIIENGVDEKHIIYINFDDLDFAYIDDAKSLNDDIKNRIFDNKKYYIFLDEIQNVHGFEKALASLFETKNVSIFVTGSNSQLLSGELATLITGRTIEFKILPFCYNEAIEYMKLNNISFNEDFIYNYLKFGGMPLRFNLKSDKEILYYLKSLYQSIINRDILSNNPRIDKKQFNDIASYVLVNSGNDFSAEKISKYYYNTNHVDLSINTIKSYIDKLEKAFLISSIKKFNLSGKGIMANVDKYYAIDNGFRLINTNSIDYSKTFYLENLIYNELIADNFDVYIGKTWNSEVDFVAIKNNKKCFIQVAYLLNTEDTIKREFGAFSSIKDNAPKYVLSLDKLDFSQNGITHINIEEFLNKTIQLNLS